MNIHSSFKSGRGQLAAVLGILACGLTAPVMAQAAPPDDNDEALAEASRIEDSGNGQTGIFHLNQSAADGVQQENTFAAGSVAGSGAAIVDAASSQNSSDNQYFSSSAQDVQISGVANQSLGVSAINQSSATGSSQGNIVVIASSHDYDSIAFASAQGQMSSGGAQGLPLGQLAPTSASIGNFANQTAGVVQANQSTGFGGQQLNMVAIASAGDGIANADATASLSREAEGAPLLAQSGYAANGNATIADSFNATMGIAQVNQSAGSGNLQTNLVAAAFGRDAFATAISDAGLGAVSAATAAGGSHDDEGTDIGPRISGSFDGFSGIGQVSQVVGSNNITANTVAVSVTHIPAGQP